MSQVLVRSRRGGAAAALLLSLVLLSSGIWTDHARAAVAKKPQKELLLHGLEGPPQEHPAEGL